MGVSQFSAEKFRKDPGFSESFRYQNWDHMKTGVSQMFEGFFHTVSQSFVGDLLVFLRDEKL